MTLESLIDSYGYAAILVGTFLEGETILVLGGIAAKLGYLKLDWVIACAFGGTLVGDQPFFFLGRRHGKALLQRHPAWNARVEKVNTKLERHRIPLILGFRFLYGLRSVTPFVIGMSRIPVVVFVPLNVAGAALWAAAIGVLGFIFGHGLELLLQDLKRYEIEIFLLVVLAGTLIWIIHMAFVRKSRKPKRPVG